MTTGFGQQRVNFQTACHPAPRPKPTTDPTTGRFLPGHVPANKGKTWGDYFMQAIFRAMMASTTT